VNVQVRVSRPINGISVNGCEWLLAENGKPLVFDTAKETLNFLASRNCTLPEICELDFEIEEA
jgi:hypothetical protein